MGVSGRGSEVVPSFPAPPSMRFLRLALLPLVLLAPVADAQVEIDLEAGTLTVLGTATVTAPPDQAVVRLGVETRAATPAEALRQHEEDVARVLAEVRGFGIADRAITIEQLNLGEERDRDGATEAVARRLVSVRIGDLRVVPDLIASVVASGANRLAGLDYTVEDPQPLEEQALVAAVTRAREKAERLAEAAGLELGTVLAMSEQNVGGVRPYAFARGEALAVADGNPGAYSTGLSSVDASVIVRFALLP